MSRTHLVETEPPVNRLASPIDVMSEPEPSRDADPPAVRAFNVLAADFDDRFGAWQSVAAQRRAVRRELLQSFRRGSSLLELGGGTGEDALFLATRGRRVLVTDGAAAMLERVERKATRAGLNDRVRTQRLIFEQIDSFPASGQSFDGAYSNFAALNCIPDLTPVARGLAPVLPEGAHALLVLFGPFSPGELVVQLARGNLRAAFRRLRRGAVRARLGGHELDVWYPSPRAAARACAPWFQLVRARGIGVFVPPSAAEPAISAFPRVLAGLEGLDRMVSAPLAWLGDHVLLDFRRTDVPASAR